MKKEQVVGRGLSGIGGIKKRAGKVNGTFVCKGAAMSKPQAKVGRSRVVKERILKNLELSVTILVGGEDIDGGLLEEKENFLRKKTLAVAKCSLQREEVLHFISISKLLYGC